MLGGSKRQTVPGNFSSRNREAVVERGNFVAWDEDVGNVVVGVFGDRPVYLRDVATIVDGAAERRSAYDFNGREAVEISVVENPNASSPQVIAAVMARIAKMESAHPG